MALTIAIEGKGVIANCDAETNDTGGTGTGDWAELGGGTFGLNPDVAIYATGSIGNKYASKQGITYFTIGETLDFDTAGTEENQLVYIWLNIQSTGQFETYSAATNNLPFAIVMGQNTSNYRGWVVAAGDASIAGNGWYGGWKCFVIDPTTAGTNDVGTYDAGNIQMIGVQIDCDISVRADSIFIDQIAVGEGLRITGTSTQGWKDVVDYCNDYSNRAWGMMEEREGVYYAKGKIYIGDSTQTAITDFADQGRTIKFETSEYYSGSAWVTALPTDACGIILEDAASYATTFEDGVIVGTENGRSGSTIIGSDNEDVFLDFDELTNAASEILLYGTTFKDITGAISLEADSDHKYLSVNWIGCSQVVPNGGALIRNNIFAETADVDAALLWNENINIQKSNFIANTIGAAIEMPSAVGTPYTYTALFFSGNTNDVLNSSGSTIAINKASLSDPSTSEGSTVNFQASSTIFIRVQDESNADISGAFVYINDDDAGTAELNDTTDVNGEVNDSYSGAVSTATLRVRKYGYKPFKDTVDISSDLSRTITLIADPQQS